MLVTFMVQTCQPSRCSATNPRKFQLLQIPYICGRVNLKCLQHLRAMAAAPVAGRERQGGPWKGPAKEILVTIKSQRSPSPPCTSSARGGGGSDRGLETRRVSRPGPGLGRHRPQQFAKIILCVALESITNQNFKCLDG